MIRPRQRTAASSQCLVLYALAPRAHSNTVQLWKKCFGAECCPPMWQASCLPASVLCLCSRHHKGHCPQLSGFTLHCSGMGVNKEHAHDKLG